MASKSFNNLKVPSAAGISRTSAPSSSAPLAQGQIYSQTANTGTGEELLTQVRFAVEHLQGKPLGTVLSGDDIAAYLSLQHGNKERRLMILMALKANPSVRFNPEAFDGKGGYAFKPKYDIANGTQLLARLQSQSTFQGFPAKGLEEGWPKYKEAVADLDQQNKVLVLANKKDATPKTIWADDPSLWHHIDDDFKELWTKTKLPNPEDTATELEKHGLLPTNKHKKPKVIQNAAVKKQKKSKKTGKVTNYHMQDILKDYSHKRK